MAEGSQPELQRWGVCWGSSPCSPEQALLPWAWGASRGKPGPESGTLDQGKSWREQMPVQEASEVTWDELRGALAPEAFTKCLWDEQMPTQGFLLTEGHNLPTPLPVLHGCQALCEVLGDRLSSPWSPQESCVCPATQLAVGFRALLFPYLCALQCLPICLCHGVTGKSCGNRKPSAAAMGPPRAPSVRRTGCLAWQGVPALVFADP